MSIKTEFFYSFLIIFGGMIGVSQVYADTALVMLKDINPGVDHSRPGRLTSIDGRLYFQAEEPVCGEEVWISDGTPGGTEMLKDIYTGAADSNPSDFTKVNGMIYFNAEDDSGYALWRTDGTSVNTSVVSRIQGGMPLYYFTPLGDTLFFTADDGHVGTVDHGRELWKHDTVTHTTEMVKDILPGTGVNEAGYLGPRDLTVFNNLLFFNADSGEALTGRELWRSDGTANGTVQVKDIYPGSADSGPDKLTVMGDHLFFTARDAEGNGLWKTDGTSEGTEKIMNISLGSDILVVGNIMYFTAQSQVYDDPYGYELWKSDGTAQGTEMVVDLNPGSNQGGGSNMIAYNGLIYFDGNDGTTGRELWKTDGTAANTELVKDINPGVTGSSITELTVFNGALFFNATQYGDTELWTSDGSTAGTMLARNIYSAGDGNPEELTILGDKLVFSVTDDDYGRELWLGRENSAPVFGGSTLKFKNGQTLVGKIPATDVDDDPVTFSLTGGADETLFELTSEGVLSFLNPPDIENPTDADLDGRYEITVRISDGFVSAQQGLTIVAGGCSYYIIPAGNGKVIICI